MSELLYTGVLSLADIAQRSGVHKSTVSRVLDGKIGPEAPAYAKVVAVLPNNGVLPVAGESAAPAPVGTATAAVKGWTSKGQAVLRGLIEATLDDREFGMALGPSGCGKTWVIGEVLKAHPEVRLLTATDRMARGGLLRKLCKLLEVSQSGSLDDLKDRLKEACAEAAGRDEPVALIVDEADLLCAGRTDDQVHSFINIFRELHDEGATVVLVGLPTLGSAIRRIGEQAVFRRLGYERRVDRPTDHELSAYWLRVTAGIPGAESETAKAVHEARRSGLFGFLGKLARRRGRVDSAEVALSLLFRAE